LEGGIVVNQPVANLAVDALRYRCWEDFKRFGFLSAGHNAPPGEAIRRMRPGDVVYAFSPPRGYFAKGAVTSAAVRPREFIVRGPFVHLQDGSPAGDTSPLDKLYTKRSFLRDDQDSDLSELVVGVNWQVTFPRRKARMAAGLQIPQTAADELVDVETARFLASAFGGEPA
jgi:hypothetical protein